jgi:hypothetical protein
MRYRSVLAATAAAVAATLVLGGAPLSAEAPAEPQPISDDPASAGVETTVTTPTDPSDPTIPPDTTVPPDTTIPPDQPEPVDPTVPSVLSLAIDPTSGPVGTTINVSGDDCTGDLVWFGLFSGFDEDGAIVDLWWANPGSDGAWSDELFVYEAMVPFAELDKDEPDVVPVEPGGDYYVGAWCEYYPDELGDIDEPVDGSGPAPDEIVFSDTIAFEVTAAGVAPRTDPLPVNPVAVDVRPQAQPATPVVADPTYTG